MDGQQVALNCSTAVDNIKYQADLMLEVGQKNVRDGYMTQAAFDSTAPKIREAKGKYSVSDCQGASGNKKSFYQCMSSSKNHVTGCDKQFKHGWGGLGLLGRWRRAGGTTRCLLAARSCRPVGSCERQV